MARRFLRPSLSNKIGDVYRGARLFVYQHGTTTEIDCYDAEVGGPVLTQPLVTNAKGQVQTWADWSGEIDIVWTDTGNTYLPNGQRTSFSDFTEFIPAEPTGGGGMAIGDEVVGADPMRVLTTDTSGDLADEVLAVEQSLLFGLAPFTQMTALATPSSGGPGWVDATPLGAPFDVSGWFLDPFDLFAITDPVGIKSAMLILNDTPGTILAPDHFGIGLGGSYPAVPATAAIYLDVDKATGATDVTFGPAIDVLDFSGNVLTDIGNGSASSDAAAYGQIIPRTIIDAAGDLIVGTAADTAARLAIGTALQVLRVNAGGTALEWATASPGTPGGADTNVQYNDAGAFGGDAEFTFNETTNLLTLGGAGVTGGVLMPDVSKKSYVAIGPQGDYGPSYSRDFPHLAINTVRLEADGSSGVATFRSSSGGNTVYVAAFAGAFSRYVTFANQLTVMLLQENFPNTSTMMTVGAAAQNVGAPVAKMLLQADAAATAFVAGIDALRVKAEAAQTGRLIRTVDTANVELWSVDVTGAMKPASMADGAAANDRLYYSTTAGKLVYKDAGGVVNALY